MNTGTPPGKDEFELTLFGSGYGESIALHVGDGAWILVDSCVATDGTPIALNYLQGIGIDPAQAVRLIVATHWHDDHIRGMAKMVEGCCRATFLCASVLTKEELLAAIHALDERHLTISGSGVQEIHRLISRLSQTSRLKFALADRRVFSRHGCEVWSLSPDDRSVERFLKTVGGLFPGEGEGKTRVPDQSPNEVAIVLWVGVKNIVLLLGSDLEKRGWIEILRSGARPTSKASAFKIPHHGSENAHAPGVWKQMLDPDPYAVLAPWQRGNRILPTPNDVQRILSHTTNAYSTAGGGLSAPARKRVNRTVEKTIRESGVNLRRLGMSFNAIRLRRLISPQGRWEVDTFGTACHLKDISGT